jgi:predicted transcriptional regulator
MKTVEMELKELILGKYGSLAEFCKKIDLPWTTLDSILKRGVGKANIKNILKITTELGIDVERLADGKIVFKE